MIRIGTRAIRILAGGGASGSRRHRRNGYAGRGNRLIGPGDLAIGYRHVVLTQTEKATRTDHNGLDLSGLIDDEFGDVADLLLVVVIDIQPDELGGAPLTGGLVGHPARRG